MCWEGQLRDKKPSLLGGLAVNIAVVVEVDDVLCGEGMHSAMLMCVCVCLSELVCENIRDGTGREIHVTHSEWNSYRSMVISIFVAIGMSIGS